MPRNGSGSFSLPQLPFTAGSTISSSAVNSDFSDIATALTGSIAADGQTPITGSLQGTAGSASAPSYSFSGEKTTGIYLYGSGQLGITLNSALSWIISTTGIATSGGMSLAQPIGVVQDYAGSTAPAGWLLCYGQAISRTTYASLFAILGTTYGPGDGSTTFNIPDCRGRSSSGKDDMGGPAAGRVTTAGSGIDGATLGATGGAQNETITQGNLPNVNFTVNIPSGQGSHNHTVKVGDSGGDSALIGAGSNSNQSFKSGLIGDSTLPSMTGTAASGGSGTALKTMQPTIIFNKIIFAGV